MLLQHHPDQQEHILPSEESDVEVLILLPNWQLAALDTAAQSAGLTMGTMIRCLIRDALPRPTQAFGPRSALSGKSAVPTG